MSMTTQEAAKHLSIHLRADDDCYKQAVAKGYFAAAEGHKRDMEANKMAIDALRKRTPTMVTHDASIYSCHTCPSCKNVVDEFTEFVPGQKTRVQPQWCKFCGQALKWEV